MIQIPNKTIISTLFKHDLNFINKDDSSLMRFIGFFYPPFLTSFWTTIGRNIYYPNTIIYPLKPRYYSKIKHEIVHVEQYKKYGIPLFLFLYLLFPLPIFFSYFRWKFEREAYLKINIETEEDIDEILEDLTKYHFSPWPKVLMRRWFRRELERTQNGRHP